MAYRKAQGLEQPSIVAAPKFKELEQKDYRIRNKQLYKAIGFVSFDVSIESYGFTKAKTK